jgi:hypothetical protein
MTKIRALLLLPAFALGASAGACTLANPNHCFNLAIDPNAWCEAVHPDEPFCSPCVADNNGCVAQEPDPDECPTYTQPPATGTDTGGESGTDTGTDTGTDSGTDTGGSSG